MGIWAFLCGGVGSEKGVGISMWGGIGSYSGNMGISMWGCRELWWGCRDFYVGV